MKTNLLIDVCEFWASAFIGARALPEEEADKQRKISADKLIEKLNQLKQEEENEN